MPDLERQLEAWIEKEPDLIGGDVLLIGRQVRTEHGTFLDLLGIDADGALVVIELKRDQTLRETVAQGLEYAAWCSGLGYDRIVALADAHLGGEGRCAERFREKFGIDIPETLNQAQRILLVAPEIADATAAVIEYLSETYDMPINALSFTMFNVNGVRTLVRQVVVEEEVAAAKRPASTKRRETATIEALLAKADEAGTGEIARILWRLGDEPDAGLKPRIWVHCWEFRRGRAAGRGHVGALTVYPVDYHDPSVACIGMSAKRLSEITGRPSAECEALVAGCEQVAPLKSASSTDDWRWLIVRTPNDAEAICSTLLSLLSSGASRRRAGGSTAGAAPSPTVATTPKL